MPTSPSYSLFDKVYGLGTYETVTNGDFYTVKKTPTLDIRQAEINTAATSGNLNTDGSITYANIFSKGNYEQLGAPSSWMGSLANDPTYWGTINQSIGYLSDNTNNFAFAADLNDSVLGAAPDPTQNSLSGDGSQLRYPLSNDGKYDYLKISTHELIRNADLLSGSGLTVAGPEEQLSSAIGPTIALPMQPGISDSNSVDWGADQLNPLQLLGARAAATGIENFAQLKVGEGFSAMVNQVLTGIRQAGGDINESDIVSYFAGQAVGANIFTRSTGKVINPNLELLFRGPQLRSFNYAFRFTPRDPEEAKTVKTIIKHFKKHMAVKRSGAGLFLKTPDVFKLQYVYLNGDQHPFLNKIKPCALTNFNVDYTPDGSYMTYKDGSMTSYSVTMQFSELAPIYDIDYNDSDDMGY